MTACLWWSWCRKSKTTAKSHTKVISPTHHASAVCCAAVATVCQKSSLDWRNLSIQQSNQSSPQLPQRTTPTLTSALTAVNQHSSVYWASWVKNHSTWLYIYIYFFFQFKKETKILRIPPGWVSYFLCEPSSLCLCRKRRKNINCADFRQRRKIQNYAQNRPFIWQ